MYIRYHLVEMQNVRLLQEDSSPKSLQLPYWWPGAREHMASAYYVNLSSTPCCNLARRGGGTGEEGSCWARERAAVLYHTILLVIRIIFIFVMSFYTRLIVLAKLKLDGNKQISIG